MNINDANRQAWVKQVLENLPPGRILDAGAGELRNRDYCRHLEYVSQDFCEYDGTGDKTGLQNTTWDTSKIDIVSDIVDMPVENNSFDYVVCTEVFEHIKYPVDALKEFFRVLKPGGTLIVTAPFCSLTHMAPYHMYSGFNRYFYHSVMKDLGYQDIECVPNGDYFMYMEQELKRTGFIARTYSGSRLSIMYRALAYPMIWIYRFLGARAKDSSDLLCFGFHVTATKGNGNGQ